MRFTCESCGAQYMISDEKVGPSGVRVRCKKCGDVIRVQRADAPAPDAAQAQPATVGAVSADAAPGEGTSEWYVAIDDRQVGPLPSAALRTRWDAGEIGPDTLAWRAGMGDWLPVSSIPDLTRRLSSPQAQPGASMDAPQAMADGMSGVARMSGEASPLMTNVVTHPVPNVVANGIANGAVNGASNGALNGKLNGKAITWNPSAGSALASLASEELSSVEKKIAPASVSAAPAVPAADAPRSGASLLEHVNIPEGGVDPTHLIPLQMKGLERTTEVVLKPKTVAEHEPTQIRQLRKSAKRSGIAWGVTVASVAALVVAAGFWFLNRAPETRPEPVAQAPAEPRAVPAPAPAPAEAAPAVPPPAVPVAESAPPSTPPVAAAPAQPEPAPAPSEPPAPAAAATRPEKHAPPPKQVAKAEPVPTKAKPPRVAAKERTAPPPAPEMTRPPRPVAAAPAVAADAPRKKSGDPLLDVGGDDELEKELSATKPKRNVYVPPAIGSDLPDSVSVSQINEAVVGQKAALLRCIEEQRAVDSSARGTLKLRWTIGGDGATRDVRLASDEFAKQPIAPCITNVVKGIRFPRSRTTGQEVVFPFKF